MAILNGAQLLERARRLSDDSVEPYYISDEEMYLWLSEAERALAVAGKLLRNIKTFTINNNMRWLPFGRYPEILEFREATLIDVNNNRYQLSLLGTMDGPLVTSDNTYEDDYGILISTSSKLTPGRPSTLLLGKRANYMEVIPVSNGKYTVEASVILYPTYPIEEADSEPSIPERHHQAIPVGAALMALEAGEFEHLVPRITSLQGAWQKALLRASSENSAISRDASVVRFTNEMWS